MRARLVRRSLLKIVLLAVLVNTSVQAQDGSGGMFSGRISGLTNRGSDVGAANGLSTAVVFAPAVETLSPNRGCTAMNFAVQVDVAPGNTRSRTFSLVINGLASSLITCTISGPSILSCNSGTAAELVPARSTLAILETTGSAGLSVAGTAAAFGWECIHNLVTPVVVVTTEPRGGSSAAVAECKSTLLGATISWGGGTSWASANVDRLCSGTRNARDTIACFQANVQDLGWAAAIEKCK